MLSRRAPGIVILTLCASLLSAWTSAPAWLPNGLAILIGSLALTLFASRRRRQFGMSEDEGFSWGSDWIANELDGKGTPAGSYLLAFFGVVTIVLTGVETPYAMLAWAGSALGVSWGIVNARYPADDQPEQE